MPIKPVDTRMIGGEKPLILNNSYLTNLTSVNVSSTNIFTSNIYVNNTLKNVEWDDALTTVQTNSATTWNYQGTDIKALTGNWQDTYSSVSLSSTNWSDAYSIVQANSSSWVNPLSSLTWAVSAPTLSSDSGIAGNVAYDFDFFYVAVSADTWKRVALTTF